MVFFTNNNYYTTQLVDRNLLYTVVYSNFLTRSLSLYCVSSSVVAVIKHTWEGKVVVPRKPIRGMIRRLMVSSLSVHEPISSIKLTVRRRTWTQSPTQSLSSDLPGLHRLMSWPWHLAVGSGDGLTSWAEVGGSTDCMNGVEDWRWRNSSV